MTSGATRGARERRTRPDERLAVDRPPAAKPIKLKGFGAAPSNRPRLIASQHRLRKRPCRTAACRPKRPSGARSDEDDAAIVARMTSAWR